MPIYVTSWKDVAAEIKQRKETHRLVENDDWYKAEYRALLDAIDDTKDDVVVINKGHELYKAEAESLKQK